MSTSELRSGELHTGDVVWVAFGATRAREQSGHRPAVVIAGAGYLDAVDTLAIVVPVTRRDRGWPNHIALTGSIGLDQESWAMTEQPRTITRDRITGTAGRIDSACLESIRQYLRDFLEL